VSLRTWQIVRAAEAAALNAASHAALCSRARKELPTAPAELVTPMRVAMLGGDSLGLLALIEQCWIAA
jgi:hypothetical protein